MKKNVGSLVLLVPLVVVVLDGFSLRSLLFAAVFLAGYVFAGSPVGVKLRSKLPHHIDIT